MTYPKIGIRPVIDGRWGGIRESLEAQTMNMARNAAKLITETLRYPDGSPVQCVISKTTIGGGAEAAACEEQFSRENVVATLSVTPCWCYGTETFDMNPNTVKAIWGFNGTERPGAFGSVEAPDRFDGVGVHVKGFCSVAPAGRNGQRGNDIFAGELFLARGSLSAATDGGFADDALHGRTVRIAQRLRDELCGVARHIHRLRFERFPNPAPSSVNYGTDTDFRICHQSIFLSFMTPFVPFFPDVRFGKSPQNDRISLR